MNSSITVKVSVIIPVYNAERYLSECLQSVVSQTLREIEIICIDDGSTDSSAAIIQSYKSADERIILIQQENSGSGKARNHGLTSASGEYVVFMDGDDYYPADDVLEKMYSAAVREKALICGGGLSVNRSGIVKTGEKNGAANYFPKEGIVEYADVQYDFGYQRYMFSGKLLKENNILFPDYLRFQDPPFLVRAMVAAGSFYALTIDTYCYRWGHQNVHWNFRRVNDLAKGIRDNLQISKEHGLKLLHEKCMQRFNKGYYSIFEQSLKEGNQELPKLLFEASRLVQKDWLEKESAEITVLSEFLHNKYEDVYIYIQNNELWQLQNEIRNIRNSTSYRIGHFITRIGDFIVFVPRKIYGGIRCCIEHGLRYTIDCIFHHK